MIGPLAGHPCVSAELSHFFETVCALSSDWFERSTDRKTKYAVTATKAKRRIAEIIFWRIFLFRSTVSRTAAVGHKPTYYLRSFDWRLCEP